MTNINELNDEQLKELYSCVKTPEVRDEVFKRIAERCPITSTNKKLEEVKQLAKEVSRNEYKSIKKGY